MHRKGLPITGNVVIARSPIYHANDLRIVKVFHPLPYCTLPYRTFIFRATFLEFYIIKLLTPPTLLSCLIDFLVGSRYSRATRNEECGRIFAEQYVCRPLLHVFPYYYLYHLTHFALFS